MEEKTIIDTLNEAYFSANPHESQVIALMPTLLRDVEVFADIGASLGQFTKAASGIMKQKSLYAVEADPLRFKELEKNCKKWAEESGNTIGVTHGAASDQKGTVTFFITNSSVSGGIFQHELNHLTEVAREKVNWTEVTVPGVMLDEVITDDKQTLIKMDIEGAEILALEGASKLLKSQKVDWLMEVHDFNDPKGRRPTDIVPSVMKDHGYHILLLWDKHLFTRDPWKLGAKMYCKSCVRLLLRKLKKMFR